MPPQKTLNKFYSSFSYDTGFINEKLIRRESKQVLEKIRNKKGKLLDIGCGAGFLLHEAKKMGWDVTGIEMSKKLALYGKNNFGVKILSGDFLNMNLQKTKFDVIILSQVIEHLPDPRPFLVKIYKHLHDKGVLYIATPNIQSVLANALNVDFPYLIPPEHVYYYGPDSLRLLLQKLNFQKTEISTYGYPVDMASIVKKLLGTKNKKRKIMIDAPETSGGQIYPKNPIKLMKYIVFDRTFCLLTYRLLNLFNHGSMIATYATKGI